MHGPWLAVHVASPVVQAAGQRQDHAYVDRLQARPHATKMK
ncbi:MAG: hypothetical protein ABIW85_00620 [Variovorax sp.]